MKKIISAILAIITLAFPVVIIGLILANKGLTGMILMPVWVVVAVVYAVFGKQYE